MQIPTELPIVDTHAHIFTDTMPVAPDAWRKTARSGPLPEFLATLDGHHIPFGVIAAASLFGDYNDYTLAALRANPRLRGTVIVPPTIDPYALRQMADEGVVGVRWVWFMQKELPDLNSVAYRKFLARLADLDMHIDDSEVTFNINLDDQFSGSSLVFCGMHRTDEERKHSASYHHQLGRCVVHRGTHRHGAAAIAEGARTNLIIWCRSSSFRQQMVRHSHRSPENSPPDMVCLSRTHDPDYHQFASLFTK